MVGGDLLDRLAATNRLHGDPGLELGTVCAALAHRWEPFQGRCPASEVNDGGCPEKPDHLSQQRLGIGILRGLTPADHMLGE